MKRWENPELMILGVENTKTDLFGSGDGNGNDHGRPAWCYCEDFQFNPIDSGNKGHDHGSWKDVCPCCQGIKPNAS